MKKGLILKGMRGLFWGSVLLIFLGVFSSFSSSFEWWNSSWHYRFPVEINASFYNRSNAPIEIWVNFTEELSGFTSEAFDNNSVRVIEYDSSGNILYEVPSQFEPSQNYEASNAVGEVIWIMNGSTSANEKRYYMVYFDSGNLKQQKSYVSGVNYTWDGENISINTSELEIKIDTDRKNGVSGIYYAKRHNTLIFDRPESELPVEYINYSNGSDLGFDLRNNASFTGGTIRLTITQKGNETLFGNPSIQTLEGKIIKQYIFYKNNPWIKIKQVFENNASYSITRGSSDIGPLTLDAQRAFGIDALQGSTSDPYSWQSAYSNLGKGFGIINLNESGTTNFNAQGSLISGFIGLELASTNISSGNFISEESVILFNNESSHSPVQDLRDRFQNPVNISKGSSESYIVTSTTQTNYKIYNRNEAVVIRVNITQDTHNLTSYVYSTLNAGTPSSSDDITLMLYDDGTHGDLNPGDKVYTNNYTLEDNSSLGTWTVTSTVYDSSFYLLNQSTSSFNVTNIYYVNLSLVNPDGQINRTVFGNISVINYRNDSGITNSSINCTYNGSYVQKYRELGNGNYSLNFTAPSTPGTYILICNVTKNNNSGSDSQVFYTMAPKVNLVIDLLPESYTVRNITQNHGENFTINVTINNEGLSTAYQVNLTLNLEENWTSYPLYYELGNLTQGNSYFREFNITVPAKYLPNTYNLSARVNWTNLDASKNSTQDISNIIVASNPVLEVVESSLSGTVSEGSYTVIGNFTINSTGNDNLTSINITCISGEVCNNFTTIFTPAYLNELVKANKGVVSVNISVPEGYSSGNYSGIVNISSSNDGYDLLSINISVPESGTWYISPESCSLYALIDHSGSVCNVTITNTGNKLINFTISPNSSNFTLVNLTSLNIPAQSSETFKILYNTTNASQGSYNSTYTISSNGVPLERNLSVRLNVVLGPTINSLIPDSSEQATSIGLKVEVIDLSNLGINNVNATITQPNGFIEYVNLTNITENTPGGTSYWQYNYSNITQRGIYNITVNALDNGNGPGSVSSSFKVYANLRPIFGTKWSSYFRGEVATINYNLSDSNNVPLDGNVTIQVLKDGLLLMNESHAVKNGVINVVPTFQIASDSSTGNYSLRTKTYYYDPLVDLNVNKTAYSYFQVHKPLEMDLETSIVWYPNNVMKSYILLYGDGNITSEVLNSSLELRVYDPAENLFFKVTKDNLSVFSQTEDSIIYKYNKAIPDSVTMGMYLATLTLTQGDRHKMDMKTFRISSGGPYDVVIESVSPEVNQGTYLNFTIRIENHGDVSQDVYLDYWVSNEEGEVYDAVYNQPVYVASNSNRSFDRELFISETQPLGTYYLNVRMSYPPYSAQPDIETNRTFNVIEALPKKEKKVEEVGGAGGAFVEMPEVVAKEEPIYKLEITKLYPEKLLIERSGVRYLIIEIKNTGNQDLKDLTAFIDGVPSSWFRTAKLNLLTAGQTSTLLVKIHIPKSETPREVDATVKVISEKVTAEKKFPIQVFESKEELIKAMINRTKNFLSELEIRASQKGLEKNVTEVVKNLEQANDLIVLSEKNLNEGNLVKAMNFIEEANNVLERASYLLAVRKEEKVVYKFPFSQTLPAIGLFILAGVIGILIVVLIHGSHSRIREISSIKKAISPKPKIEVTLKEGKAINREKVKTFIDLKKSEIKELIDTLQKQYHKGMISDHTYDELRKRYEEELLHIEEKTCPECGLINDMDAAFCIRCGTKI